MKAFLAQTAVVSCAIVSGNFVFEIMSGRLNWALATERSYFQFLAIGALVLVMAPDIRRLVSNQCSKPKVSPAAESGSSSR